MHHPLTVADRVQGYSSLLVVAALTVALVSPDVHAATSRWSASNNRIYVEGGGSMNLTDISATTLNLPPTALQHDAANGIWLLTANILVVDGTRLDLTNADITELRLQSNPSAAPATENVAFVSITADPGEIHIEKIKVYSWDTNTNTADGFPGDGRAYIRARSSMHPVTNQPMVSRMDVIDAEVAYLGFDQSESYGLSWKANGDLGVLDVLGNVTGSHIHHNFYGIYTFGLQDGQWVNNEVDHNVGYGFDGHDDTDNVLIDGNNVHENGVGMDKANHGIILSERCDHARITNNIASGNGGTGIMLHDISDDGVIQGNTAENNADAGIALFCSSRTLVKDNILNGNFYGIRLSVAANSNQIEGNQIAGSTGYGAFLFKGTDSNGICGANIVPTDNTFAGNTIGTSAINGVKITEGHNNRFIGNTLNNGISIKNSALPEVQVTEFRENLFGPGVVLALNGSPTTPVRADISKSPRVSLEVDTGAVARFTDDAGALFDLLRDLLVDVTGTQSAIDLTLGNAGGSFVVDIRDLLVNVANGGIVHAAPTLWETSGDLRKSWIVRADDPNNPVTYTVGDLKPGTSYDVAKGGAKIGTFTADGNGRVSLTDATQSGNTVTYTLTKAAAQAESGGDDGGGGALGLSLLLAMLGGALAGRRARKAPGR
jgi:mannuronan 5-epimerase